jgi:hypothetical protein
MKSILYAPSALAASLSGVASWSWSARTGTVVKRARDGQTLRLPRVTREQAVTLGAFEIADLADRECVGWIQ